MVGGRLLGYRQSHWSALWFRPASWSSATLYNTLTCSLPSPAIPSCAQVYFMVGFVVSARILVFWGVMLLAGTCGLSLFMLLAIFSPTVTVAAALQASSRGMHS